MDIQLHLKNTNHYAFVSNASNMKQIRFAVSFVDWSEEEQDNIAKGKRVLTADEFAQWWKDAQAEGWKIVDPS